MTVAPLLIGVPLAAALLCAALGRGAAAVSAAASVVTLAMGIFVAFGSFAAPAERAFGGLVYVDALSGLIVLIVALVSAIAALYAVAYVRNAVAADVGSISGSSYRSRRCSRSRFSTTLG